MSKVIRGTLIVLAVGLVRGRRLLVYRNRLAPPAAPASTGYTQVVAVRRGNLSSTVSVVGQLEAMQQRRVGLQPDERDGAAGEPDGEAGQHGGRRPGVGDH